MLAIRPGAPNGRTADMFRQLQITRTREVVDYAKPRDPDTGHYQLKPEQYQAGVSLGSDLVVILVVMAALADSHPGRHFAAADLHPLFGCSRSTATKKLARLAELHWLQVARSGQSKVYRLAL